MIQSGLAILALLALLSLELSLRNRGNKSATNRTNSLIAALVDFHKGQCYFLGVVQVAALTLFHESRNGSLQAFNSSNPKDFKDLFDTSVLTVLATGGFIPINLTLACIARYGRQSWYLISLSFVTTTLATATLIASYNYSHKYGKDNFYDNNVENYYNFYNPYGANWTASCYIDATVGQTLEPLCGNRDLVNNALPSGIIANWYTWVICKYMPPLHSYDQIYASPIGGAVGDWADQAAFVVFWTRLRFLMIHWSRPEYIPYICRHRQ